MDSKTEPASEAKERIENEADKYIKLQGTHDKPEITKHDYIAGATAEYNRAQEEITSLKAELERERELRNKAEFSPRVAKLILKTRDALVLNDIDDAYHQLYEIVSPLFDKTSPWKDLELLIECCNNRPS